MKAVELNILILLLFKIYVTLLSSAIANAPCTSVIYQCPLERIPNSKGVCVAILLEGVGGRVAGVFMMFSTLHQHLYGHNDKFQNNERNILLILNHLCSVETQVYIL